VVTIVESKSRRGGIERQDTLSKKSASMRGNNGGVQRQKGRNREYHVPKSAWKDI
jgi:hypothetical protein